MERTEDAGELSGVKMERKEDANELQGGKMKIKEDAEATDDHSSSTYRVLQHISEEAVRVAGGAIYSVYPGSSNMPPPALSPGHKRSQSEVVTGKHRRSNSFHRWKSHMQRALRWGSNPQDQGSQSTFNPEILANQKRQWYQLHSKTPILFKYPPGKKLDLRMKDLAAFCFPGGIKEYLGRDDLSFVFSLKVADNATLYGVCLLVPEIVQRAPAILGASSPLSHRPGGSCHFLVSAPRCYCLLTRIPFFELHYEMLNSIIAQERLNRITHFVSLISLPDQISSTSKQHDQMDGKSDSPDRECSTDWMASAIPLNSALAVTAAAAGIISDDELPSSSLRMSEPPSTESVTANEASDFSEVKEVDKEAGQNLQYLDGYASETLELQFDGSERMNGSYEHGQTDSDNRTFSCPKRHMLERLGSSESLFSCGKGMGSDDEDDVFLGLEKDAGDDVIMDWAKEHQNDLLQIVCSYHALPLAPRGSKIVFQPLELLQAIEYNRPPISAHFIRLHPSLEPAEANVKLAAAEEALALSIWTTATVCRVLSLESVLALLGGVLLEKQVVVTCSNLGVLSATVLSLIPMIRPFEWQSLLLPVGIQNKISDLKMKTSNLVHVDVFKDQVKTCCLPALPRHKELVSELGPLHAKLACQNSIAKRHPVYKCNEVQAEAAAQFLRVMRCYLESFCSDLRSHTITSVQSNNDRVSLLLKDSFIDSFPNRDKPFIKLFVDTQLFSVLSDYRLLCFENEHA
ncbi:hypothetical protein PVL29_009013 [Vitis rotundifolia]|uniref:UDENN domain-containing protein n=1 Tax=Vitis rotundifolia TaxID=103349 RepID=A0AA38ZYB1_VITRO|nr:hypothetical protein PVL29_009013 [Vitis rotundifolia]